MTIEDNPFEITGMERLVEFNGSGFVGRRALERIASAGVKRKLVGVRIEGGPLRMWLEDFSSPTSRSSGAPTTCSDAASPAEGPDGIL